MPRYFFNVYDGESYPDSDGVELPTIAEAKRHGTRYAAELLRDKPDAFWNGEEWHMNITDERGLILCCLLFAGFDAPVLGDGTSAKPRGG